MPRSAVPRPAARRCAAALRMPATEVDASSIDREQRSSRRLRGAAALEFGLRLGARAHSERRRVPAGQYPFIAFLPNRRPVLATRISWLVWLREISCAIRAGEDDAHRREARGVAPRDRARPEDRLAPGGVKSARTLVHGWCEPDHAAVGVGFASGETRPEYLGNYLHAKDRPGNWTHGCVCDRSGKVTRAIAGMEPVKVP